MNLIKVDLCSRRGILAAVGHHLHIDELQQGHHGNRAELVAQTLDIKANQASVLRLKMPILADQLVQHRQHKLDFGNIGRHIGLGVVQCCQPFPFFRFPLHSPLSESLFFSPFNPIELLLCIIDSKLLQIFSGSHSIHMKAFPVMLAFS